jgi:hypothetical protein
MMARPKRKLASADGAVPDLAEPFVVEETMRIRPDEVERRALPFKNAEPATTSDPPPTGQASVWSTEAVIRREDLPSALAPSVDVQVAQAEKPRMDGLALVAGTVVLLVGLVVAAVLVVL